MDARVLAAMSPYFTEVFGNPSSLHSHGQEAAAAVEKARAGIAILVMAAAMLIYGVYHLVIYPIE